MAHVTIKKILDHNRIFVFFNFHIQNAHLEEAVLDCICFFWAYVRINEYYDLIMFLNCH